MRALLLATSCLLAIAALGGTALADEYGELQRIGGNKTGIGNGQLNEERTRLLGVDPSDNSVYVLDEPERFTQAKKLAPPKEPGDKCKHPIGGKEEEGDENPVTGKCVLLGTGPITRHFRIQKFTLGAKTYAFAAAATFTETSPAPPSREPGEAFAAGGVEGIAVDPALKRLYVLSADDREAGTIDTLVKRGSETNTHELQVASSLYAFSTVASGETLPPAEGTKAGGVLIGPGAGELEAQSSTPGKALLQPAGITVDPETHDVIVLGHVDEKGEVIDSLANAGDHFALQRIGSKGELKARFLDKKADFFKHTAPESEWLAGPDSPVLVALPAGGERVYVDFEGLAEVPYDFTSEEAPHIVSKALTKPNGGEAAVLGPLSSVQATFGGHAVAGGGLAASPAADSALYTMGFINTEEPSVGSETRHGVLASSSLTGAELGWSGGQAPEPLLPNKDQCATTPGLEARPELPLRVAAGKERTVFVLSPEFLKRIEGPPVETAEEEEERAVEGVVKSPSPFYAGVIEFGPKPTLTGCPQASASAPLAQLNGKPLSEKEAIPAGTAVTFSSLLKQGDALRVKWEFSSGATKEEESVSVDQFEASAVNHTFNKQGTFTVTETIETDNLATPSIVAQATEKVVVSESPLPSAQLEGPASAVAGAGVSLIAKNPAHVAKYKWTFGDGKGEETSLQEARHVYGHACECKVDLVVANAEGKTSAAGSYTIKVSEPPAKKEEPKKEEKHESPKPPEEGKGGVKPVQESRPPPVPNAVLASNSLSVTPSGVLTVNVTCPAGETTCTGTVTLRTLTALSARKGKRKAILTLASGSFTVAGGHVKSVTLHLSAKGRTLLARAHVLRAHATILAHDTAGASHTSLATVTLRVVKAKKRHH